MASQAIGKVTDVLSFWGNNLKTNLILTFTNMQLVNYIRLIAVVGAYLLLRPYLIKLGAKAQRREHEKVDNPPEAHPAKISANDIRGRVEIPDDSEEEEETGTDANWGKKARKRQRQVVKKLLEAEEKRLKELEEEEEDKELEEFLKKYSATGQEVTM